MYADWEVAFNLASTSGSVVAEIVCSDRLCSPDGETLASHAAAFDTYYTFEATVSLAANTIDWTLSEGATQLASHAGLTLHRHANGEAVGSAVGSPRRCCRRRGRG